MKKIVSSLIVLMLIASCSNNAKVGYINIQEVFNGFQYKKELEKDLESVKNSRQFIMDSLETELKIIAKQLKVNPTEKTLMQDFQTKKEIYLQKKSIFKEEEENMVKQLDEKIIKQLNSYIKQYGKENNYALIHGATSTGNIMYADTTLDISKPIINYINLKYAGK
jgi:outer membrane protein